MTQENETITSPAMDDAVRAARRKLREETWEAGIAEAKREGRAIPADAEALRARFINFEIEVDAVDAAFGLDSAA